MSSMLRTDIEASEWDCFIGRICHLLQVQRLLTPNAYYAMARRIFYAK